MGVWGVIGVKASLKERKRCNVEEDKSSVCRHIHGRVDGSNHPVNFSND